VDKDKYVWLYKTMYTIRRFEETVYRLFNERVIIGPLHTYIGEEAIGVGISANLKKTDLVVSNHRGHGHAISKGIPLNILMAELCARATGCCHGKGGSMHIANLENGVIGSNGIVGAGLPIATGLAWAQRYLNTGNVVVAYFGDGASSEGSFHESLNLASLWKLPVIFVCENNQYAVNILTEKAVSVKDISIRSVAYSIPGITIDGMDVIGIAEKTASCIKRARDWEGPSLIEAKTYRFMGHSRGDPKYGLYRSKEEWDSWQEKDPLKAFKRKNFLTLDEINKIEEDVEKDIADAVKYAMNSPFPRPEAAFDDIYADTDSFLGKVVERGQ
jgi:TPP-dependent pyruvate/acetoin dehydrogenase alpha subunit